MQNDVVIIPNADADDAQASHQTAHESTQPEYNTDVIIDEDPSADGYLADNEESDEDAPLAQVSTCCFIYIWQGNWQ